MRVVSAQLLTAEQLAERWQVNTSHVYRLAREARIPTVELGRYYRVRLDAIERFEVGEQRGLDDRHGEQNGRRR
jgi:excisionase family DNA binding protein